jgi:hypothetical protein
VEVILLSGSDGGNGDIANALNRIADALEGLKK